MKRSTTTPGSKQKENTVLLVSENTELMKFLLESLPKKSRNNIKSLLANKQVIVEGKWVKQFNHLLVPGQKIEIRWNRIPEERKYPGIKIIHEDDDIIIIEKEAGMLSIATDREKTKTAYSMLSSHVKSQSPENKIFVIHRLDRDTSGLMMFAKNETIKRQLQSTWEESIAERTYIAVVEGIPVKPEGTISSFLHESKAMIVYSSQNPESGQKAVTHYQTMNSGNNYSLLKVNLDTGRKNQIRVHLKDLGYPIAGDKKYGAKTNPIGRLGLHAWVLAFEHPVSHEKLRFETSIPGKFLHLV